MEALCQWFYVKNMLLYTHTCPVTEFAVASHLNTANSCCHHVFLRHFRFQKCLPVNSSKKAGICEKHGKLKCLHKWATYDIICRTLYTKKMKEDIEMKHVKTLSASTLKNSMKKGGCGECQTSCQSACKTSCTVGNQSCENQNR